jgi:hypothetical protein
MGFFFFLPFLFFIKNNHLYGLLMAHKQIAILFKKKKKGFNRGPNSKFLHIWSFIHIFFCPLLMQFLSQQNDRRT